MEDITYECPVCKGKTLVSSEFSNEICKFCWGKKNLNWLEVIFGVKYDKSKLFHTEALLYAKTLNKNLRSYSNEIISIPFKEIKHETILKRKDE